MVLPLLPGIIVPVRQDVVDNRYTLVELLGRGGTAKVYLAHDDLLDQDVALKILREQYAEDEKFVERFRREAQSVARLSHPNIVPVYNWGRSGEDVYYIAMEYVPRGTLRERIQRHGSLSSITAIEVASQIAYALSMAHENGMIHRDVKSQNVLVTENGDVKVTDFGIAQATAASSLTTTGVVLGTATHISPEQALGKPASPESDLYSLGVVLYEMLTGTLPYDAETSTGTALMHVSEPVRSPREENPNIPEALDALTTKLLAKRPEDRYPSAAALLTDLDRARSGLPPAATRLAAASTVSSAPARIPRHDRRPRRFRKMSRVLVALVVSVGLLGGLVIPRAQEDPGVTGWVILERAFGTGGETADRGDASDIAQSTAPASSSVPVEEQKGKAEQKEKGKGKEKDKGKQKGKGK